MWLWFLFCLKYLCCCVDEFDLVFIVDEVVIGFGWIGKFFVCEWVDIVFDIMVVGKFMIGGYLIQLVVLCFDELVSEVS